MNNNMKESICKIDKLCCECNCHNEALDVFDIIENAQVLYDLLEEYLKEENVLNVKPTQSEIGKVLYNKMING